MGVMLIILFLLCLWGYGILDNFQNKSISSPFKWVFMCILLYILGQNERLRKVSYGGGSGECSVLPQRARGCYKRLSLSFGEMWDDSTPPLLSVVPVYKYAQQGIKLYDKFCGQIQVSDRRVLLAARKRFSNLLQIPTESMSELEHL